MKCSCYTGVLDFTVDQIETLFVLKDTACQVCLKRQTLKIMADL